MDENKVTPDNNKDEFEDVLEIMKKRRAKPETSTAQKKIESSENTVKPQSTANPVLKGALADTVVVSVDNSSEPQNMASDCKDEVTPSENSKMPEQNISNEKTIEHNVVHISDIPVITSRKQSTSVTESKNLDRTTEVNTANIESISQKIAAAPEGITAEIPVKADKPSHKSNASPAKAPSNDSENATIVNIPAVKPASSANTAQNTQDPKVSVISLDDFSKTTSNKKAVYDDKNVKVSFLGSVWFGIIKIILYLAAVIAVSGLLSAIIIYVANDVFAFVKDAKISAKIPVGANSIEISSILNENDIISDNFETKLEIKVIKNNSVNLEDTLNTIEILQPLKDAGITQIKTHNNTSFEIVVPAGVDISVVSELLDLVNATEVSTEMQIVIDIPENATTADVGKILKKAGVIEYPGIFKLYANYRIDKRSYLTGEYLPGEHIVNPMMNYDKLLDRLSDYKRDVSGTVRITIPEGLTVNETLDLLQQKGVGRKADYKEALQEFVYEYDFITGLTADKLSEHRFDTNTSYRLEGYLFPDTYDFYLNENPVSAIDKFLANFDKKFEEEYYTRAAELGFTVDEIIILASMIEKEGNNPSDYYYISSVFHNRLKSSEYPYLNSDATLQYALSERKGLYDLDTSIDHPYNTYKYRGLPPGPICNPGVQAIDAALYPEKTNYYFFYTKKNGETVFSRNYDEHQRIVNADKAN